MKLVNREALTRYLLRMLQADVPSCRAHGFQVAIIDSKISLEERFHFLLLTFTLPSG